MTYNLTLFSLKIPTWQLHVGKTGKEFLNNVKNKELTFEELNVPARNWFTIMKKGAIFTQQLHKLGVVNEK